MDDNEKSFEKGRDRTEIENLSYEEIIKIIKEEDLAKYERYHFEITENTDGTVTVIERSPSDRGQIMSEHTYDSKEKAFRVILESLRLSKYLHEYEENRKKKY